MAFILPCFSVCFRGNHIRLYQMEAVLEAGSPEALRRVRIQCRKYAACAPQAGSAAPKQAGTQLLPDVLLPGDKVQWTGTIDCMLQ